MDAGNPSEMTGKFECSVCMQTKDEALYCTFDLDVVCMQCVTDGILPLFKAALEHEHHYPAKSGPRKLDVGDFEDMLGLLGSSFVERYRTMEEEYQTPLAQRLYCSHTIRADTAPARGESANDKQLALHPTQVSQLSGDVVELVPCGAMAIQRGVFVGYRPKCYRCNGHVCGICGGPVFSETWEHTCIDAKETEEEVKEAGLTQGRDFQLCPRCGTGRGLLDGCNHMVCPFASCGTEYCFLCGQEAHHDSDHWSLAVGKCPRWGQADADNPMFDELEDPLADEPLPDNELRLLELEANLSQVGFAFAELRDSINNPTEHELAAFSVFDRLLDLLIQNDLEEDFYLPTVEELQMMIDDEDLPVILERLLWRRGEKARLLDNVPQTFLDLYPVLSGIIETDQQQMEALIATLPGLIQIGAERRATLIGL